MSSEAENALEWVEQLKCMDCEIPYVHCGADMYFSEADWKQIYPKARGKPVILCPNCLCKRVEKLPGGKVIKARIG